MKLLELIDIHKIFKDKTVLNSINLSIESGEISSVFGYSGEGKSTILKIICGIIKQDGGNVLLGGMNINNLEPYERHVALVMDEPLLFPHMSVIDNIAFGLNLKSNNIKNSYKKAMDIINLLGISGLEKRYPHEISMGQAQRVSIARALVVNPKVILMDEPFSNLDIISKTKVRKLIKNINKELKISVLLVTHDIEDVMNLSDKMFILNGGVVQDSGKPGIVLKKPSSMDSAFLLGTENIFNGIISEIDEKNKTIRINTASKFDKKILIEADYQNGFELNESVYFVIRPEEIMILREDKQASKPVRENNFEGAIASSVYTSRMVELLIDAQNGMEFKVLLPFHAYEVMNLYEGKRLSISLKKSAVHLIKRKERLN